MHLVDMTMFYGPRAGGVSTYLRAKRRWIATRPHVRHTLVVPAARSDDGVRGVASVPCVAGYRWPVGRVARLLDGLDADLIEVGDPFRFAWAALAAGRRNRIPVIGFYHSDLPRLLGRRLGGAARQAALRYVAELYARFDLVLAPSNTMVRQLRELGLEQVQRQALGVDADTFHPSRREPALRAQLGLPDEARLLVFAGRAAREKNLPLLIDAARRLGPPYHLLLVGGCRYHRDAGVTCVPFEQERARLARLVASCDVFVHAGDQETFGLAVLEAMACALPVVGVAAGGVAELVTPHCGALARPNDAASLAQAVAEVFERGPRALGDEARRLVERQYTWERVIHQLFTRYARLCTCPLAEQAHLPGTIHAAD